MAMENRPVDAVGEAMPARAFPLKEPVIRDVEIADIGASDVQAVAAEYRLVDEITGEPLPAKPSELEAVALIVMERLDERAGVTIRMREDGIVTLRVEAGAECGYSPQSLESVVTSAGGARFLFVAKDVHLAELKTDLREERKRFDAWHAKFPMTRVGHFQTVARDKGGPPPGFTWAWITLPTAEEDGEPLLLRLPEREEWCITEDDVTRFARTVDDMNHPAIAFGLRKERREPIEAFMNSGIMQPLAILVGDHILSRPVLRMAIPSGGVITGGGFGFSEVDVRNFLTTMKHPMKGVRLGPALD